MVLSDAKGMFGVCFGYVSQKLATMVLRDAPQIIKPYEGEKDHRNPTVAKGKSLLQSTGGSE